ncbi:hypothetical protein BCON_1051g00010 [Botryotinia convoluta]|uniref:RelA/SpoT domain-containing protein n=1 Tax=Botryotinia convoluta TaxID=54673 RepID=A0A4Z1H3W9_9HELO|nr:hypothetical protein BCON_1051g00010 [Botryotinia convoluta]
MVIPEVTKNHINEYADKHYEDYKKLAEKLKTILVEICEKVAPYAIVQTRPKSISSFSEKIFRKSYYDPCKELTDLCGGRIIAHTTVKVEALAKEIEDRYHDEIDTNSVNHTQRLESREFGYRSIHYIIKFKQKVLDKWELGNMVNPRVEVQIRTLLEHAWADISHAYTYKSDFPIPELWKRETFRAAALLENVDTLFSRMHKGLEQYKVSYGTYMTREQIQKKIDLLWNVLITNGVTKSERADLALTIGRLSVEFGRERWAAAETYITENLIETKPDMLLQLGILRCKLHNHTEKGFIAGQEDLKNAFILFPSNTEALVALADTYELKGEHEKAQEKYKEAFGLDPSNPRVLTSHVCCQIQKHQNGDIIEYFQPLVRKAIAQSQDQIDISINLPLAFYATGLLYLFLGEKTSSFSAYSKAVKMSDNEHIIKPHIKALEKLLLPKEILGVDATLRFLRLSVKQKSKKSLQTESPVIIISVGNDQLDEKENYKFWDLVLDSFIKKFKGKILGAREDTKLGEMIDTKIKKLKNYDIEHEFYKDSLNMCEKIADCGISSKYIKLLEIEGCERSGEEYQMALALGARVGLLPGIGGQAKEILTDLDWNQTDRLQWDQQKIQAFIYENMEGFVKI